MSSSDLLLSVATAQWRDRDAREVIHQLVDDLNETGLGFAFTKDLVLKAGLVLLGRGDIRSKVGNFDRQTMQLHVHLNGRDTVFGTGHLEVHVAGEVFGVGDVT